ncbi:MAG: type III-B CRISPR-associated protein Cas10/Cmr2 [Tepidimonas sp.]|uniref:type III-B CRISPR-associated protein Cas10/Cmr2 n=1 Tax=Tepidimonas sp. TaxID=2002775 RepID=UPI00298F2921|nr:type III-B CRISPR-associated protein Cas10/Cmr2 [Tepidimonas sp.]MDW8336751.1 type III-B CRISPR-associated protein Cas10/Cmr2 [Tepidimonas sp.]
MTTEHDLRLQARLAARLHDPPEKALVLMRTTQGHEGGTVRDLLGDLFPQGLTAAVQQACERADHWASAADRMAFPKRDDDGRYPAWQQVQFADQPVLIHPLTGQAHTLPPLANEIAPAHAQAIGTDHLRQYVIAGDLRRTALALWRFGPELSGDLAELWRLLPADSRVPDHTIHDHLDLTAALASCLAVQSDGGPALLAVSLGPVQDFIAAARSVSDLWAGSHLLSHLSWVAMRVVCESLGPEAILFPRLRGVAAVDLWLLRDQQLKAEWFDQQAWRTTATDANPLFAAALPNRFTAIVPARMAQDIAQRITQAVRQEALTLTRRAFQRLLQAAGMADRPDLYGYQQIERQLQGFPEVHWAAVPWSLAQAQDESGAVIASDSELAAAMQPFFDSQPPGFLTSTTWQHLSGGYKLEQGRFFRPNPGALYPALHELLERVLAAAKATRPFAANSEQGWRCSLTGEAEWITTDAAQLGLPPGQRKDTLWARAAGRFGIRAGEHLSALPMLKRLWPTLYVEDVRAHVQGEQLDRYVVSTHTMALSSAIEQAVQKGIAPPAGLSADPAALPARLAALVRQRNLRDWARVPSWLEAEDDSADNSAEAGERERQQRLRSLKDALGAAPDAYYGLLLMDGDGMGAWLSASSKQTPEVRASFHPQLQARLETRFGVDERFIQYAQSRRAPNPAWHMAISQALNHFALELAPTVIEKNHLGKLIYAGGDDVMAMLATRDLLQAAAQLRAAYSGIKPEEMGAQPLQSGRWEASHNGWARFEGRVLRLMGRNATASAGLVIAHHQAPLGAVLRALRQAEQRAKRMEGKDAWSLAVLKRGGGALYVTAKWGGPLRLLHELRLFLQSDEVSRRAAYHLTEWLHDVPAQAEDLVSSLLAYQMARQARGQAREQAPDLAQRLVKLAFDSEKHPEAAQPLQWLANFMLAAEFLARSSRHQSDASEPSHSTHLKEARP